MPRRTCLRKRTPSRIAFEALEARCVLAAQPVITEFMAGNDGATRDTDGEASDWIEISNLGDEPISLDGWYLTDKLDQLTQWRIPAESLLPGEQLLVFASGKDRAVAGAELHTNFQLGTDGELLALVEPNGTVIASSFAPEYPRQFRNISYGIANPSDRTELISPTSPARVLVPTLADDAAIGQTWNGSDPNFSDATWLESTASLGYRLSPFIPQSGIPGEVAYTTPANAPGSQAIAGPLGMDFVVTRPITIMALGAFDDGADGIKRTITVELWSRNDQGTPNNFGDDTGGAIVASTTFTAASPGTLVGGTRYKALATGVTLAPGAYTISAEGYGFLERAAVGPEGTGFGAVSDSSAIRFVGQSRYGVDNRIFPGFEDIGPVNRYGAGSFTFVPTDPEPEVDALPDRRQVAYETLPGVGNATTSANVGMDFTVTRPVRITDLGVFDSGQDGIAGALGVSIWSRTTGAKLAEADFLGDRGSLEVGSGSRFLELAEPVILQPGVYAVVASGFFGSDMFSRTDGANPRSGKMNDNSGALVFGGSSSTTLGDANRFLEEFNHRLTDIPDLGPVYKFAAGSFKYEVVFDDFATTNLATEMFAVNPTAYVRIPFQVGSVADIETLLMDVHFDDGFVAYLNGNRVAVRNAPAALAYNSPATLSVGDNVTIGGLQYDLSAARELLVENATNVLAIQALNSSSTSADMALSVSLVAERANPTFVGYFTEPTPLAPNGNALLGFVEEPTISARGGIVEDNELNAAGALPITISTFTPGATIYYTLDGTTPSPTHGTLYTEPLMLDETATLRAAGFKPDFLASPVATTTYLFLDDVLSLSGIPDGLPFHWNGTIADYGITQDPVDLVQLVGDPNLTPAEALEVIKDSLRALPTMSIVLDSDDLFAPTSGVYANPYPRGRDAEKPASVEYFLPDGTSAFQIDAGLRMMGWTSRIPSVSPKHSMRLAFRDEYGEGRLNYKMFPGSEIESYDTLSLRNNSRDTWLSDYPFPSADPNAPPYGAMRSMASYIRDQWSRTVMADMGNPSASGNYVHLYLNGVYWGVYNPTERPDGAFAAELNGGNEDDYDAVTFCNPTTRATHGDLEVWNSLVNLSDFGVGGDAELQRLLGNNPDGTRNPNLPVLVELENFIDYIIAGQFDATDDWPCNFYAFRERNQTDEGFTFLTWDNDLAFPVGDVNANRLGIDLSGTPVSSPWRFQAVFEQNAEYRLQFADQVHEHLFNGGALSPARSVQRWFSIGQQVRPGLIAESARWGDYRRDVDFAGPATLYTPGEHWDSFNNYMLTSFLPQRSAVYVQQLRDYGLYPNLDAASLDQHGGEVDAGFSLGISAPTGTIFYTLDGSDPRSITPNLTLVPGNAPKRVFIPTASNGGSAIGTNWTGANAAFNDSAWRAGTGGIGYETDPFGNYAEFFDIDVEANMFNAATSAYVRIPFNVDAASLAEINFLDLNVRYDDGFVAYLNGVRIASVNAPNTPIWSSAATDQKGDSLSMLYESFDVSTFRDALRAGANILAIHGLNTSVTSSDFLLTAELIAGNSRTGQVAASATEYTSEIVLNRSAIVKARVFDGSEWSALTTASFTVDNGLRVSELNYNPSGDDSTEYVEITNTGSVPVDLTGIRFTDGIQFEFLPTESNLILPPGGFLVVASNPTAFAAAFPTVPPANVADNPYVGQLDNGGEQIILTDAGGGVTQQFTYDDSWYPDSDGGGRTLVVVDATADRSNWNLVSGWKASQNNGGTPGADEPIAASTETENGPPTGVGEGDADWPDMLDVVLNPNLQVPLGNTVERSTRRITRPALVPAALRTSESGPGPVGAELGVFERFRDEVFALDDLFR